MWMDHSVPVSKDMIQPLLGAQSTLLTPLRGTRRTRSCLW
jgi:hypothetical protein